MTEIKIEKKTPIWPWILLILIILVIIAYFVLDNDEDDVHDDTNTETIDETDDYRNDSLNSYDTIANVTYDSALNDFNTHVKDSTRIGSDSIYTKTAFHKLADIVVIKANQHHLKPSESLSSLKSYNMYRSNPSDTMEVSNNWKRIGMDITRVIQSIQTEHYPSLAANVSSLKEKSDQLSDSLTLDRQQQEIRNFIRHTRDILNSMNP